MLWPLPPPPPSARHHCAANRYACNTWGRREECEVRNKQMCCVHTASGSKDHGAHPNAKEWHKLKLEMMGGKKSNKNEAMGKKWFLLRSRTFAASGVSLLVFDAFWYAILNTRYVRSPMASRCLLSLYLSLRVHIYFYTIKTLVFRSFIFQFHSAKVTCQINLKFIVNIRFVSCRIETLLWIGCTVHTPNIVWCTRARIFFFFFRIAYAQLVRISRQLIVVLLFVRNVFLFAHFTLFILILDGFHFFIGFGFFRPKSLLQCSLFSVSLGLTAHNNSLEMLFVC